MHVTGTISVSPPMVAASEGCTAMTWQGAGGTGSGGTGPDPEDVTQVNVPVPPQPSSPFEPGGPLADDAALAAQQAPGSGEPPAPPPAAPGTAPSGAGSLPPVPPPAAAPTVPWEAPQPDAWASTSAGGGRFAVPGAPGLVYAGAVPRLAAWFVDVFLLAIVTSIVTLPFATPLDPTATTDLSQLVARGPIPTIISILVDAAYFILLWGSGGRGTLGMRLFKIQVGDATTGNRISLATGLKRWLLLGTWLGVAGLVPALASAGAGLQGIWALVLLVTVATSATKQGLHDRIAGTAMVRPASAGNGLAWGCLLVFLIIPLLAIFLLLPLIYLGGQVSDILSQVGTSI